MRKTVLTWVGAPVLLLSTALAGAQNYGNDRNFYNGVRDGGRGASYDRGNDRGYYDRNDRDRNRGDYDRDHRDDDRRNRGIGAGGGAAIGGLGGAVLGGVIGHGLKGALVGGAAGAGIGAIAGQAHRNNERNRDDYYYGH